MTSANHDPQPRAESENRLVWLRAGQELLRDKGIAGVKIHALREVTGRTTGSFYHHFENMSVYLAELAHYWSSGNPDYLLEADDPDPIKRLRKLIEINFRQRLHQVDVAMRDWAGFDDNAAEAVRKADETLLTFLYEAFTDLGFDTADARMRAHVLLGVGVARVSPPWKGFDSERLFELLTDTTR